jgi:cytochrome c
MNKTILSAGLIVASLSSSLTAQAAGDAANGEKLYKTKCGICHTLDQNKIGPMQRGLIGRKAGIIEGFSYSPALKASGLTWDEATVDKWLVDPSALVTGTKMVFKVPAPQDRADIIAYLKSVPTNK